MNILFRSLILIFCLLSLSCAMTMPETRTYSIVIAPDKAESLAEESAQSIAIHIDSDDYLKQPYIVQRPSSFEMDISHYSKWESSPYKVVRREFVRALSSTGRFNAVKSTASTPKDFYLLALELRHFELLKKEGKSFSSLEMDVILRSPEGAELYKSRISKERAIEENDFRALAEGLSTLLSEALNESIHAITDNL